MSRGGGRSRISTRSLTPHSPHPTRAPHRGRASGRVDPGGVRAAGYGDRAVLSKKYHCLSGGRTSEDFPPFTHRFLGFNPIAWTSIEPRPLQVKKVPGIGGESLTG